MLGALCLAAATAGAAAHGPSTYVGVQVGALFPVGISAMVRPSPRWAADVAWEPSGYLQSYGVGAAYHPGGRGAFVGARLRLIQLHAPWSRGYDAARDNRIAFGGEVGLRRALGRRLLLSGSLGTFRTAGPDLSLPGLYTLNVGLAYRVRGR